MDTILSSCVSPAQAGTPNWRDTRGFGVPASAGGAWDKFTVRFCDCAHAMVRTEMRPVQNIVGPDLE